MIRKKQVLKEKQQIQRKISNGRGWIVAVALLMLVGGILMYGMGQSELDKSIAIVNRQVATMDAEQKAVFEKRVRQETGATWEEAIEQERSGLKMLLVSNLVLAAVFFGLFFWAGSNPFAAALTALIIYLTVIAINLIIDPPSIAKGIIFKIMAIGGLGSAVSAALKSNKIQKRVVR